MLKNGVTLSYEEFKDQFRRKYSTHKGEWPSSGQMEYMHNPSPCH